MKTLLKCMWPGCPSRFPPTAKAKNHKNRHEKRKHDVPMTALLSTPRPPRRRKRGPILPGESPKAMPTKDRKPSRRGRIQIGAAIRVVVAGIKQFI